MKGNKLRICIAGLGGIAQKVYLPYLSKETEWLLNGAFSPTESKRNGICSWYRIKAYSNLTDLFHDCDAVFVHSSTASHYEIVSEALKKGKDVYVDKPLASTIEEAEALAELSIKTGRKLMVGFNRRFAPMYVKVKQEVKKPAWVRIEKHRLNGIRPVNFEFTVMDDYIHLVDTARWLGEPKGLVNGKMGINKNNQLIYARHDYETENGSHIYLGMHRNSGTNLEQIEFTDEGSVIRVKNMDTMEIERDGNVTIIGSSSWDTITKRRGFEDAIMHFINSVKGNTNPKINGEEALKTQKLVNDMLQKYY